MKKILLALTFLIILSTNVEAKGQKRLEIEINGELQPKGTLVNIQKFEMIPVGIPANIYGYSAEYIEDSKKIVLNRGAESIIFEKDSDIVFVNGVERLMKAKAILRNNKIYVPLEVFRLFFHQSILYDKEQHRMIVWNEIPEIDTTPVFGENVPTSQFTIEATFDRSW